MCEYSGYNRINLDCLDAIDDILGLDGNDQTFVNLANSKHEQQQQQQTEREHRHHHHHHNCQQDNSRDALQQQAGSTVLANHKSNISPGTETQSLQTPSQSLETEKQTTPIKLNQMSWRNNNLITCMLITANVGTIFEESTLLELWFQQLKSYLIRIKPQLVAIHCQEVGGKNFETSMKNVSNFTDKILGDQTIIRDYSRVRIFLDDNFECLEKFTALGSLYLVHDSVDNVKLYNFKTAHYDIVEGRKIFAVSDKNDLCPAEQHNNTVTNDSFNSNQTYRHAENTNITNKNLAEHIEKVKFPQDLFPECRWSRKGFMRTRWLFNDCQPLDLVNIHLFHDASNIIAMKAAPSPYAQNRQKALDYALQRISIPLKVKSNNNNISISQVIEDSCRQQCSSNPDQVPLFIFGDFNFRLDTSKVIQRITEGISPVVKRSVESNEVLQFVYHRKMSTANKSNFECEQDSQSSQQEKLIKSLFDKDSPNEETQIQKTTGNCDYVEDGGVVMTVGKKLFDFENLDETFRATENTEWLLELDNELDSFKDKLLEFKISFSPSYPFKEDESGGHSYMKTRCPAWCDRILFNTSGCDCIISGKNLDANEVLESDKKIELLQSQGDIIYRLMGNSVPMGDHKPVLLYCQLRLAQQSPPRPKCNESLTKVKGCSAITTEQASAASAAEASSLVESTPM